MTSEELPNPYSSQPPPVSVVSPTPGNFFVDATSPLSSGPIERKGLPWDIRWNPLTWWSTFGALLFKTKRAYEKHDIRSGLSNPIGFASVALLQLSVAMWLLGLVIRLTIASPQAVQEIDPTSLFLTLLGGAFGLLLNLVIFMPLCILIYSCIVHLGLLVAKAGSGGFSTTVRVVGYDMGIHIITYSMCILPFALIPDTGDQAMALIKAAAVLSACFLFVSWQIARISIGASVLHKSSFVRCLIAITVAFSVSCGLLFSVALAIAMAFVTLTQR